MKTVIIGGGKGCRSLLGLATGAYLKELKLDILAVVDTNPEAPGVVYAKEIGLATFSDFREVLDYPDVELIIELTGDDNFLQTVYSYLKPGIKIIDHTVAHVFWDLVNAKDVHVRQLSELEKLEKAIEKDSLFLQSIFNANTDLSVVVDLSQNILIANSSFLKFLKFKPDVITGKNLFEIIKNTNLSGDSNALMKAFNVCLSSGKTEVIIHLVPSPKELQWEITYTPILNINGEVDSVLTTWHRITDRVKLMREITSAEMKFKSFINSANDWISLKDLDGRYLIVNPVIADAFDKTPEDFIGKSPEDILPARIAETVRNHDRLVIETRQSRTYRENIPIHGIERHFNMVRFPLLDYKNEVIGTCTLGRDVTNEVRLQDQLIQNEKLAALGKLAAGVAHEINNPLTGILAYAEDLLDDLGGEDTLHHEDLRVIIRETLRCRDIVRNLLDFARQDNPKFENVDPDTIVNQAILLIKKLPQFKDIQIGFSPCSTENMIKSDPMQIQQVILNFMLNASDAMKYRGKIQIKNEVLSEKGMYIISVEDTGPGIPENLIDKIFEPFFSSKGTSGLGLAVSWGIIERHGGTIEVDTAETGGAIFRILIPIIYN